MKYDWTRRRVLTAGTSAAAVAGLGVAGWRVTRHGGSPHHARDTHVQYFVSRPDLNPPKVELSYVAPGHPLQYLFLGLAASGPGQGGAMIMDTKGDMIWFSPDTTGNNKMDFALQSYQGEPVLTWFQGRVVSGGHGEGVAVIADTSYRDIHTIHAASGLLVDLHEFQVTSHGTALVTAYRTVRQDLSSVGGPKDGWLLSGVAQEIDIVTGKLLFEWDSLDHIPLSESNLQGGPKVIGGTKAKPYDYFHINTIAEYDSEHLLIGARNTWCAYLVRRSDGQIVWRLGGPKSDFEMGPGSQFYWQHDTRPHGPDVMTVFDDGYDGVLKANEKQSRALILDIDHQAMRVSLRRQFTHHGARVLAKAMGNVQLLPDGGVFVGWGTNPYFTQYAADGTRLMEGVLTVGDPTYRSYIGPWAGHPTELPAAAARTRPGGGATVYASWNGATDVASWTVLAGKSADSLTPAGSAPRNGFETAISVRSSGPYFAAQPHDASGKVLARSRPVKLT